MNQRNPPVKFLVEPYELRKASAVIMTAIAMLEASHATRAGRPLTFLLGQAMLAPLTRDLVHLAGACIHTAANYESCEAALAPGFLRDFDRVEPMLIKSVAGFALSIEESLGGGETLVNIFNARSVSGKAVGTVTDVLTRLTEAAKMRQIGVEIGTGAAGRQFTVYLPGTQNWDPVTGHQAFDLTSDLAAMSAPGISAPERATIQALGSLGFGTMAGDTAVLAGYSEGGLVAANLVASGAVTALGGTVAGVIAVGSPINSVRLPASTRVISLEHANDPVTKLDLSSKPASRHWFTQKFAPTGLLGHSLEGYRASLNASGTNAASHLNKLFGEMRGRSKDSVAASLNWFEVSRTP